MESLYKRYVCSPIFSPLNFISGLFFMSFVIVVQSLSRVWTLWQHGLQHTRLPCLSFTIYRNLLKPMSVQWCYLTILPSVIPFFTCLQSFPNQGLFSIRWPFIFHVVMSIITSYSMLHSVDMSKFHLTSFLVLDLVALMTLFL